MVHNVQRSCGEGGGFGISFYCSDGGDHAGEKAEMALISHMPPVLGDDVDTVCRAGLKVQQGPTEMLKKQVRLLLFMK